MQGISDHFCVSDHKTLSSLVGCSYVAKYFVGTSLSSTYSYFFSEDLSTYASLRLAHVAVKSVCHNKLASQQFAAHSGSPHDDESSH